MTRSISYPNSVRILDSSTGAQGYCTRSFTATASGYAECYAYTVNTTDEGSVIQLLSGSTRKAMLYFREGNVSYWNGTNRYNLESISAGSWHRYRIDFNCASSTPVTITIDDERTYGPYTFEGTASTLSAFRFGSSAQNSYTCDTYFDNVKVATGGGPTSGSILSTPIAFDWNPSGSLWERVRWTQGENDSIVMVVERRVSGSWLPYDSLSMTSPLCSLDIGSLGSFDTIRLRAKLRTKDSNDPELFDWSVAWNNNAVNVEVLEGGPTGSSYDTWSLGMMPPSSEVIMNSSNRAYIKNSGGSAFDLRLSLSPIDWSYGTIASGIDTCLVMALFSGITPPVGSDFLPGTDYLNTQPRNSVLQIQVLLPHHQSMV
jgi:hypothetical protein